MKKLIVSMMAGAVLLVGGAGLASAQADPVVTVDKTEVEPGGEVTVNVSGAEADSPILVGIGETTGEGTTDADGNADIPITIPDNVELGELDGIVNINGVDYPISVVVAAAAEAEGTGDGTPQPTAVNTGDGSSSSDNSMVLFAAAAGLLLLGGGAVIGRRHFVRS